MPELRPNSPSRKYLDFWTHTVAASDSRQGVGTAMVARCTVLGTSSGPETSRADTSWTAQRADTHAWVESTATGLRGGDGEEHAGSESLVGRHSSRMGVVADTPWIRQHTDAYARAAPMAAAFMAMSAGFSSKPLGKEDDASFKASFFLMIIAMLHHFMFWKYLKQQLQQEEALKESEEDHTTYTSVEMLFLLA
ncbi:hypothetical protein PR002_g23669 [Phytophthora rubi]|uniref:Uncharacterized protein n=1 Tax=Phytophthora rubi TaxID=129364 RepID=A0A6A3IFT8_9STRA|nr:hypothetical protein PR002_g23669 [Phytophthora rubi]